MRAKLTEWIRRYLPLEIAATVAVLIGGFAAAAVTDNAVVIAYAATFSENVGFYGIALVREVRRQLDGRPAGWRAVTPTLMPATRNLVLEFGPAELLDSLVVRPFFLWVAPVAIGSLAIGLVVGKVLADICFFGLAILSYEWWRR